MSITSLAVGIIAGNVMGVVMMCLLVCGKRADEEMEQCRIQIPERRKQIRFLDHEKQILFSIPDGESIELAAGNGEKQSIICRYIDEGHASIDGREWELLDFAEQMEKRGILYHPL